MNSYSKEHAIEQINHLRAFGLPSIFEVDKGHRKAYTFSSYEKCLVIVDNMGNIMNFSEMKRLIGYLKHSIDNLNIDKIINEKIEILQEEIEQYSIPEKKESKEVSSGYVYLIEGENGRHKIGFSKNAERRTKELCLSSCEKHTLIHSFYCKNPYQREQRLHKKYSSKRTHTEWFKLEEKDIAFIKGLPDEV